MMAGTGVNISGAGMLRTRRKDISIKPNRRLDRKSSRGMIYENEELRLRTIHINAAIEQGQSDIKKLRKENEQLRREIWCLRDEYDKLEEILRKQKSHDGSDECESRSEENEASQLSNSERGEEEYINDIYDDVDADNENLCNNHDDNYIYNEEKNDDDDEGDYDDNEDNDNDEDGNSKENRRETSRIDNHQNQDDQLKNTEIHQILPEKANDNLDNLRADFDGLSVVDEEEEQKKVKVRYESDLIDPNESDHCLINSKQNNICSKSAFSQSPFIFPNVDQVLSTSTGSQIFKSTSTLKLDAPVAESSNSKVPKLPKTSVNFENHSPSKLYLDSPRFFTRRNQSPLIDLEDRIGKVETQILNSEETDSLKGSIGPITPSSLNVRPKHIFAPLSLESKRFRKQSSINEISTKLESQDNRRNDQIVSNIVINNELKFSTPCKKGFRSADKFSVSLENLFTNKKPNFSELNSINNLKTFSSCRNLNDKSRSPLFLEEMKNFNKNSSKERYVESNCSQNNYDPSKPFKSQLSVVLKSPRKNNIVTKEIPESPKRSAKNCRSLNNLFFPNTEISTFNKDIDKERYNHGYQATSFEGPYPITLQIPSVMPIELDYKNVPYPSRRAFYYPGEDMQIFYDSPPQKISAHTQTLDEDISQECNRSKKDSRMKNESAINESSLNRCRRKNTKKEKFPCEKKSTVDRRKRDILKNQVSISSCDESESPNVITGTNFEVAENKHESRSSSSEVDSQRKEQTHRVSVYFNSKKRPSLTSMKSTRNTNMDNSRNRVIPQKDNSDGNTANVGEQTNSMNNKEMGNSKRRKTSTSSENVPWCACWGNGCI